MNAQAIHFVTSRIAEERLGVPSSTLRTWADAGDIQAIRTPGQQRLYNVDKFLSDKLNAAEFSPSADRIKLVYCRVSSDGQRDDLNRQIEFMRAKFPEHTLISDIGSGINWKRKGLRRILELVFRGHVSEIVVAHRDRLSRFAFELLEWIFSQHRVKLLVLDDAMEDREQELVQDVLSILHVYSCRVNGKRTYGKRTKAEQRKEEVKNKFKRQQ
jgi:putative resolvase